MAGFGIGRAIFRAMISQLVGLSLSSNFMVREARRLGISYRRQIMLQDIREIGGLLGKEASVKQISSSILIPKGVMVETDLRRARNYRVFGDVVYTNVNTGVERRQTISFYDDQRRSKDDYISFYERDKEESEYLPEESITSLAIRSVEHNKGLPY